MASIDERPGVVIADSQFLIIEALRNILSKSYNIIKIVHSKYGLKEIIRTDNPDILVVDFYMLDFVKIDELKDIKLINPAMAVVILTNNINLNDLSGFYDAGIHNFLLKNSSKEEFFSGINAAVLGKKNYPDTILRSMLELSKNKAIHGEESHLTSSETDIVRLIAQGLTTKEIAAKKNLSVHTVMTHRKNIFRKLGVCNASGLTFFAVKTGIIDTIEYHI